MTSWVFSFTIYSSAGHDGLPSFIVDGQCYDFLCYFYFFCVLHHQVQGKYLDRESPARQTYSVFTGSDFFAGIMRYFLGRPFVQSVAVQRIENQYLV
jgi:hypothetical protein